MSELVINIKNGNIYHDEALILNSVNLEVKKGQFMYLIGKTGTGKSSLLKTLYAELPLKGGNGSVAGFDLANLKEKDIPFLRRKIGIVFQNFEILMDRNVFDNLRFVLEATGWTNEKDIRNRIDTVLAQVGIQSKGYIMPATLSGGEQQRVAVARALMMQPKLILADEPSGNLDTENAHALHQLFFDLRNEFNQTFIIVTHNKQTMSSVEAIYGVTMVEQGVSRVVPVSFSNLN